MPRYDFRCACGDQSTATFSMATVPDAVSCPACDGAARRIPSSPHLGRSSSAAFRAIDSAARSAHEPQVVSGSLPGARRTPGTPVTRNPLHAKLPRT